MIKIGRKRPKPAWVAKRKIWRLPEKLTEPEFLRRHEFCVTPADILAQFAYQERRTGAKLTDEWKRQHWTPICENREDGWCGHNITPGILESVNANLARQRSNDSSDKEVVETTKATATPNYIVGETKRKRGRPRKATTNQSLDEIIEKLRME